MPQKKQKEVHENHIVELSLDDLKNRPLRNPDNLLEYIERNFDFLLESDSVSSLFGL